MNIPITASRIACLSVALMAAALAQNNTLLTTGVIASGSGSVLAGSSWANATVICTETTCGGGPVISSWVSVSQETRKDDGKGPTLKQVKTSAVRLSDSKLAPANYITLAKSVGVEPDEALILQAIHEADLAVYDFVTVDGYLYRAALRQKANMRWLWEPVRDEDYKRIVEHGLLSVSTMGLIGTKVYARELPIRVLAEMKEILAVEPEAMFLVSDYEVVKPDPFLAVSTTKLLQSGRLWIVDQWDEPGFGGGEESGTSIKASLFVH